MKKEILIKAILPIFREWSQKEVSDIMMRSDSKYISIFLENLSNGGKVSELFKYGISFVDVRDKSERENLSEYFFLLSEIKKLPEEARSFALDVSVFLEDNVDTNINEYKNFDPYKIYNAEIESKVL